MSGDQSPGIIPSETESLRRQIFLLALPVLGEQFLTFCIGFFDVYLSGRLGKNETAAIGLSAYISWLASMIFSLIGTGTSAIVSAAPIARHGLCPAAQYGGRAAANRRRIFAD